jgi:hypothetical protein
MNMPLNYNMSEVKRFTVYKRKQSSLVPQPYFDLCAIIKYLDTYCAHKFSLVEKIFWKLGSIFMFLLFVFENLYRFIIKH